jgi:nitrite reductase (NADH) large subunit
MDPGKRSLSMNIVIAGGGVAGTTAAEVARQEDPSADITVFALERERLSYRPRLPEIIEGRLEVEKAYAHPESWYIEKGIELRKGESLLEICLDNRLVRGSMGSRLIYDRLLVATGAEAARPAPVDYQLPGVYTVRKLDDAMSLFYDAKRAKTAVILGGGILALEIAAALAAAGPKVHVLERSGRILPRQTTPGGAERLAGLLSAKGLEIHLGTSLAKVKGRDRVSGVELSQGDPIDAQLLIVCAGVVPNLELAKSLGLKTERGVVVDRFLETTLENVFAAGDCAQTPDGAGGLWSIARQQGLCAGRNLVREPKDRTPYEPIVPSSVLKVAGIDLVAAGDLDPDDKLKSAVCQPEGFYRKVVVGPDGVLRGYTNLGTTKGNRELAAALGKTIITDDLLSALAEPDFDFGRLAAA